MRGDRPDSTNSPSSVQRFTPHARGSTRHPQAGRRQGYVYPACAGIDLSLRILGKGFHCLPRMRGDRPVFPSLWKEKREFTPHARGSTSITMCSPSYKYVYPACAGIDLFISCVCTKRQSLPRMRGDRPYPAGTCAIRDRFTPHARGSTFTHSSARRFHAVYPACAGIDLFFPPCGKGKGGLPRMRGDRPGYSG